MKKIRDMKRLLLIICFLLISFVGRSQQQWVTVRKGFDMTCGENLQVSDEMENSIVLWNPHAETIENKAKNVISYDSGIIKINEHASTDLKRFSFRIEDFCKNPYQCR